MAGVSGPWMALVLLLGGLALGFVAWVGRPRGARICCPGPPPGLFGRLHPRRWFLRCGCWYNLTGLPAAPTGARRCPECGTVSVPRRWMAEGRRWRPLSFAAVSVAAGVALVAAPWFWTGQWARSAPTIVLAAIERLPRAWQPSAARLELHARVDRGVAIGSVSTALIVDTLIRDLANDGVRWNAARASGMLDSLWPASRGALEAALVRGDRQSRLIAASVLRDRCPDDPPDALLVACIEDLRDDPTPVDFWTSWNAISGAVYLARFPVRAEPLLRDALRSNDPQQQFLAAVIAGFARRAALMHAAAPILIAHLRDDDIEGNARLAAPALLRFGPAVIPLIQPYAADADGQLRSLAHEIVARLSGLDPRAGLTGFVAVPITETARSALDADLELAIHSFRGTIPQRLGVSTPGHARR